MSNDSMGNLEKLGILVIVILVVVVGVVAITPSDTLLGSDGEIAVLPEHDASFEPVPGPDEIVRVEPDFVDPADDPWPIPVPSDEPDPPRPVDWNANVPAEEKPTPAPQPDVVKPDPIRPAPVEAPSFREITVQKNDSLWRIAERELGEGSRWGEIARANPSVDPDRLQADQKLRIPLERGDTTVRVADRPGSSASLGGIKTYTVKPGDTPMGVSSLHYGTVKHYRFLLEHNGLDEDGFQADMTIEIPPLPETTSNLAPTRRSSAAPAAPAGGGERFYEVQKGDVPGTIAREQLGDESRWPEILRLNGIADASQLIQGSRIRLPRK